VVGVADGDRRNAFTAAWVTQVSFRPLLLAVSVSPGHASYPLLRAGGASWMSSQLSMYQPSKTDRMPRLGS